MSMSNRTLKQMSISSAQSKPESKSKKSDPYKLRLVMEHVYKTLYRLFIGTYRNLTGTIEKPQPLVLINNPLSMNVALFILSYCLV